MKRKWITGLGASLVAAALVAGCAGATGGGSTAAPAATEGTAAPAPAIFTGTGECRDDPSPPVTVTEDANNVVCERTMADPRLSGTMHLVSHTGGTEEATAIWSDGTLENDEGSWGCTQFGVGSIKSGTGSLDEVCVGRGAYAGLTAYLRGVTADSLSTFGILAWIEGTAASR
jgi:hypothetical protein